MTQNKHYEKCNGGLGFIYLLVKKQHRSKNIFKCASTGLRARHFLFACTFLPEGSWDNLTKDVIQAVWSVSKTKYTPYWMTHSEIARADEISGSHELFRKQFQSYWHQSTRQCSVRHLLGEDTIKIHDIVRWCVEQANSNVGTSTKQHL